MEQQEIVTEMENALVFLEQTAERCSQGLLQKKEVSKAIENAHKQALAVLIKDSDPYRVYDRATNMQNKWVVKPAPGWAESYANADDCNKLIERIQLLRTVVNTIEPEFLRADHRNKDQFYFNAGDSYNPKKQVYGVMKKATSTLSIIDLYLDEEIFGYIESLSPTLSIKMLTGTKRPMFQKLFKALLLQRRLLEARSFTGCHDRFIVVDDVEVWQIGASINGFGKAAFMFNRINEQTEQSRFLADLSDWWQKGDDLSI